MKSRWHDNEKEFERIPFLMQIKDASVETAPRP